MKYSIKPIKINDLSWYYEEGRGICVVCEKHDVNGQYIATTQTTIPWSKLKKSVNKKFNPQ